MPSREIKFRDVARAGMLRGIDLVARAVAVTLGPKGRSVLLDRHYATRVTKEGVGVTREIELEDRAADIGVHLMRHVAVETSDDVGDGTSLAVVLAHAIAREGVKAVAAGMNPMELRRGIEAAVSTVVDDLRKRSRRAVKRHQVVGVATIAANGDPAIGGMVADALAKAGPEGVITVEEGQTLETEMKIVDGFRFDRGYLSAHFINEAEGATCELADPCILVSAQKLSAFQTLVPVLEAVVGAERPLLVIAEDIADEALGALVVNTAHGKIEAAAVKGPSFGEHQTAMLEDIAVVTGAQIVGDELGLSLEDVGLDMLGSARRAIVTGTSTVLIEGAGKKRAIRDRCNLLRAQVRDSTSEYHRERLQERLAKLGGGVVVIRVGGASELEVKERRDRFDMALRAARAAREEGVVAGGGAALLGATRALDKLRPTSADQRAGIEIVRRALREPARRIAENGGFDGAFVVATLLDRRDRRLGFDAQTGAYVDMFAAGIIDATKVVCTALQNAASVGGLLITTEALVTVIPEPEPPMPPSASPESTTKDG